MPKYDIDQLLELKARGMTGEQMVTEIGYGTKSGINSALRTATRLRSRTETLCWNCIHAVPTLDGERGCPWSRAGEQVEGWTATPTEVYIQRQFNGEKISRTVRSFRITHCPMFIREPERAPVILKPEGYYDDE